MPSLKKDPVTDRVRVQMYLPAPLAQELRHAAEATFQSPQDLARQAIRDYLRRLARKARRRRPR